MGYRLCLMAIVVTATVASCDQAPVVERPAVVPSGAVWSGGADGGFWFYCENENSGLLCRRYSKTGASYIEQMFAVCARGNLSNFALMWSDANAIELKVAEGVLTMVPLGPPIIYANGEVDVVLTGEAEHVFNGQERGKCVAQFPLSLEEPSITVFE